MSAHKFQFAVNRQDTEFQHPYILVDFRASPVAPGTAFGSLIPQVGHYASPDLRLDSNAIYSNSEADGCLAVFEKFSPFDEENEGEPCSFHDHIFD